MPDRTPSRPAIALVLALGPIIGLIVWGTLLAWVLA